MSDPFSLLALLIVLALCLSLLVFQGMTGVPPLSSNAAEAADVVALLRQAGLADQAIIDELGCGWGSLVIALARAFPHAQIRGIEMSPFPYWVARLRTRNTPNVLLHRGNFYDRDLTDAQAVTCYLMIKPMPKRRAFSIACSNPARLWCRSLFGSATGKLLPFGKVLDCAARRHCIVGLRTRSARHDLTRGLGHHWDGKASPFHAGMPISSAPSPTTAKATSRPKRGRYPTKHTKSRLQRPQARLLPRPSPRRDAGGLLSGFRICPAQPRLKEALSYLRAPLSRLCLIIVGQRTR